MNENEKEFFNNKEYICAYCLNKREDRLCDDFSNDCGKVNVLRNDYSDYLENCITKLLSKKQQLIISFLEDKINMCDGVIDTIKSDLEETQFTFNCKKALEDTLKKNKLAKKIYQKVLDFVNKGGKDE